MQVSYELSERDFLECFLAHRNRTFSAKWSYRLMMVFVLFLVGLALLLVALRPDATSISNAAPLVAIAAIWALFLWGTPRWMAKNQFSKQPAAQGRRTARVDDGGVHWQWDGGSAEVNWKNIIRYVEGKDQILLYTSPVCFNILPKRAFTAEELAALRSELALHVGKK